MADLIADAAAEIHHRMRKLGLTRDQGALPPPMTAEQMYLAGMPLPEGLCAGCMTVPCQCAGKPHG